MSIFNKKYSARRLLGFIVISIVVSWLLATGVDLNKYELGAAYNMLLPPLVGLITLGLFAIVNGIGQNHKVNMIAMLICCLVNLFVGIVFHFEWSDLPFGR